MTLLPSILAVALLGQAAEPPAKADPCALPANLREALQQRFGSSRLLKAADLYADERELFSAEHRGACPGLANGRFFGPKERPALALVVLDVEPRRNVRLVVARPAMSVWTFFEVEELEQGSTAVVSTKGPGTYTDARTSTPRSSTNDVVVLTGLESWQRVFIWNGRVFQAVPLSD
jgi:hypothetical protein